ncbi:Uncharacterised protein [Legionella quateirensis]|uniref:LA2681-like HEPN domain-containing protein n=2 Tax=Legionella quateirensis TaxID=45072 RepID=A0A378KQ37_9GAMM|nr:hypothetical protein Lqua_2175 [Legionella quateirensis]STY16675.1 Uncharacterised protein [Legionella quateirensis]
MDFERVEIDMATVSLLSQRFDELIDNNNYDTLEKLCEHLSKFNPKDSLVATQLYYIIGTGFSTIFSRRKDLYWFSEQISKAVLFFRKALHEASKIGSDYVKSESDGQTYSILELTSRIKTNLANYLSSQGRAFDAIPLYDDAIALSNPVAYLGKARHLIFLAKVLYDDGHKFYHRKEAYRLIEQVYERIDDFPTEIKKELLSDQTLNEFSEWFRKAYPNYKLNNLNTYKEKFNSRKQEQYLKWAAHNRLFINDLNDISVGELVYQDVLTLPSFCFQLNPILSPSEELVYHSHYDEMKNDYCYARYLLFSAKDIPNNVTHFSNSTFSHVDSLDFSITNLKSNHYRSSFRILYSLFDKLSFFIHRFFNVNDLKSDKDITFPKLFLINKNNKKIPHPHFKENKNYFFHALYFILKDMRKTNDDLELDYWFDPEAKKFEDIRNALEHRSLKLVDDFGFSLSQDSTYFEQCITEMKDKIIALNNDLEIINSKLTKQKKEKSVRKLINKKELIINEVNQIQSRLDEKIKLSSHNLVISIGDFEARLMQLMKLARNALMYLSLAIHFDERNKPNDGKTVLPINVPLK